MASKAATEKPQPSAPDSERLILGTVLADDACLPQAAQIVSADDFYDRQNRLIFAAMTDMLASEIKIDRVTLAEYLNSRQRLTEAGGLSYLVSLDDGLPPGLNVRSYAEIVREKSRLRRIIETSRNMALRAMRQSEPSTEIVRSGESSLLKLAETLEARGQVLKDYIDTFPGGINVLLNPAKWERGIPTGFTQFDDWTDGFHRSEIFMIGARPGVGKSSMGLNIARYLAMMGVLVVLFSLEMSKQLCLNRLICENARVPLQRFRSGNLNEDERLRLQPATVAVRKLPIFIDDTSGLTVPDIAMRLQAVANEQPVALCIIDYVQLLKGVKGKRYSTENERFEDIANDLQNLTKKTGIPQLLLSQLSRESEKTGDKRPRLSGLRSTGAWEQIANVGALIHRPELTAKKRDDYRGVAELWVEKNRSGPSGMIQLRYIDWLMQFEDAA